MSVFHSGMYNEITTKTGLELITSSFFTLGKSAQCILLLIHIFYFNFMSDYSLAEHSRKFCLLNFG